MPRRKYLPSDGSNASHREARTRRKWLLEQIFTGRSSDELRQLEQQLKRIGRQAESMLEQRIAKRRSAVYPTHGRADVTSYLASLSSDKLSAVKSFFVFLTFLLIPSTLFAWGGDGHQIVALIAEERLTPEAQAGIHELLGKDVNISDAEIASWADNIRRESPDTASWHFVDIPTTQPCFDRKRDGRDGDNVINALNDYVIDLGNKSKSKPVRAEALKFVVHFVGDIHQPLHCAERNDDRGGNARLVFFLDQPRAMNLHSVWDTQILLHDEGNSRILDYAQWLNRQIQPEQAEAWAKGTPENWVNESHQVAVDVVYKGVPADGPPPKLDAAYIHRAEPIIEQQLERGGVRLAEILNRSFAESLKK